MKFQHIILTILLLISASVFSQTKKKEKVYYDLKGKKITKEKYHEYMRTGNYKLVPYGWQLKKLTTEEKAARNPKNKIGKKAPELFFKDMNGTLVDSNSPEFKDKILVLNFWFTRCPPCIKEIPDLNSLYEKHKDNKDVVFMALTFDNKEKVNTFLEKHQIDYPIMAVSEQSTISKFGGRSYPTNIIVNKKGNISYWGGSSNSIFTNLDNAIRLALLEK